MKKDDKKDEPKCVKYEDACDRKIKAFKEKETTKKKAMKVVEKVTEAAGAIAKKDVVKIKEKANEVAKAAEEPAPPGKTKTVSKPPPFRDLPPPVDMPSGDGFFA